MRLHFKELQGRGENVNYESVLVNMKERDAKHLIAPTKPVPDAVILDTTPLDATQSFAEAVKIAESKLK
jgi:cytidylate kinase